ncbi:MAG: sulfotransferase family 2 domain-containing protein [Rhodobacteraceae bacterium]|nr:sulfotransferase family 2 domain-containing protein [Paracoccaceae bacterium]
MIISPGRRYVFVHIPKTGGTALSLALEARAMRDDILIGDTPKARARKRRLAGLTAAGRLWKHSTLADIDGVLAPDVLAGCLVFTLVRNPWDRMVSYYHWLRVQRFDHPAVHLAKSMNFSSFLHDPMTRAAFLNAPFEAYTRAPDGAQRADLFVRLEQFEADIAPLEAHLGFALTPLARVNTSARHPDYRSYYSDADALYLGRICAADVLRFGYRF